MTPRDDKIHQDQPGPEPDEGHDVGAENEHGDSAPLPFAPHEDDDSPLGDTDQHSNA